MRLRSIALCGTSLTLGYPDRWSNLLQEQLTGQAQNPVTVQNFGIGAASSVIGLANKAPMLASKPDVAVIEYSMNDAFADYAISMATCKANALTFISDFRAANPNISLFLMIMNPCVPGSTEGNKRLTLDLYNQQYRDIVAADPTIGLIDNYAGFGTPTYADIPDGVHPPLAKYRAITIPNMVAALLPAINKR